MNKANKNINISFNNQQPLVSISCLTYNHESFIHDSLQGFLMQKTTFAYEILIHDDASTDGTVEIIRDYQGRYPNVIYPIYQTENRYSQGVKIGSQYQYPRVRGKYYATCEGDDYWTDPYKLQKQVDFLEVHNDYSACFTNACFLDEIAQSKRIYANNLNEGDISMEDIINKGGYIYPTASLVYRFDKLQLELQNNIIGIPGDSLLILNLGIHGKIYFMDQVTCVYRRWSGGVHSGVSKNQEKLTEIRSKAITGYSEVLKMTGGKYRKLIKRKISRIGLAILKNSRGPNRLKYLRHLYLREIIGFIIWKIKFIVKSIAMTIKGAFKQI